MNRVNKFRCVLLVIFMSLLTISAYAQQEEPEAPVTETKQTTKTRTDILNELSLRTAQVVLENAKEEYERYKSMYEDAQRLFKKQIINQMELDTALSLYTRAQQMLKQAEIQLEQTKLNFLAKASHITIMEAKKYYDS
ncbi:MAG TPA: TolC family protein, partial [Sedimentisphaerales bacterium]|nr:TolC family protein [Sedimentisphaerales bacterium]